MIYVLSVIEVVALFCALMFGIKDQNWAHGTFFLVLALYLHAQFESYEADRRRQLIARAHGEKPPRRSGLPWASYYT
jgi:hypothetical protein